MCKEYQTKNVSFQDLGLPEQILSALDQKGYGYPTRVQAEAIPPFLAWKDVLAKAPTGTGKTFAFGIPMIVHVDPSCEDVQGLILAPTRELAIQIGDELKSLLSGYPNTRVAVLYGGQKLEPQFKQLKKKPQIVVATPGRLMDHYKRHTIRLDKVQTVVLDELKTLPGRSVIVLGSGVAMMPQNAAYLKELGRVYYIKLKQNELLDRMRDDKRHAWIQGERWEDQVVRLYKEREPAYRKTADVVIDAEGKSVEDIAHEIIDDAFRTEE